MVLSDEYINNMFSGTNFGEEINNSVRAKRQQILKTLTNQVEGFWSGRTAYHMVVNAGLLHDDKPQEYKKLTTLGAAFMNANGDL